MKLGSTNSWADSKAVIEHLADIHRTDESDAAGMYSIAGDKETFRLMYPLICRRFCVWESFDLYYRPAAFRRFGRACAGTFLLLLAYSA